MNRGLRFRNISNINSNKNKFRNLKVNNQDNLRFNSDSSNPNSSILTLRASNTRGNRNTNSLKENLKQGRQNIESRMTKGSEELSSIIFVG